MRILAITNLYPNPYQPGRGTPNRQHFRALAATHQLRVVAPIGWLDELVGRLRGGNRIPGDRRGRVDGIDVTYPRFVYPPRMFRSSYGRLLLRAIRNQTLSIAGQFEPDVLLGSWTYPDGYAAVELARRLGLPAAVQVLGSDVNLLERYADRRAVTADTLQHADLVITVSKALAGQVARLGVDRSKIRVVYRGIDGDLFHPGSQPEARAILAIDQADPMLVCVGNLVPVKGASVLIDACARLADRYPRMQCHFLGDGPLRGALRRQAARRSLMHLVRFAGAVQHHQLATWYRAADLVVLPSLAEGVPNVLLEAIACGRPYVASEVGGIPEISAHSGCRLAPPGDPDALAEAIASALCDATPPSPSELPTASWEQAAQELSAALSGIVHRHENKSSHRSRPTAAPFTRPTESSPTTYGAPPIHQ